MSEEGHSYKDLKYTSLNSILEQGPVAVRRLIEKGGHTNIPLGDGTFEIKASSKMIPVLRAEKGMLFMHKKRGTKVTVIQPNVDVNSKGEAVHIVIESRTGKEFRAFDTNLERC